jgi:hypothetical protein
MMKTKVAMAISLAGVLAAGTAAALVNTSVLNGGSSSPLAANAPLTQSTSPSAALSPAVDAPVVPAAQAPAASATQATYAIGESGTVTLDTAGDVLAVVAVTPAAGWTVTQSEAVDRANAEVKFQSGTVDVEFHANLVYGVVRTSVESHDLSATNGSVAGDSSQSGLDDSGVGGEDGGNGGDGGGGDD